jgi:hypothetical protein
MDERNGAGHHDRHREAPLGRPAPALGGSGLSPAAVPGFGLSFVDAPRACAEADNPTRAGVVSGSETDPPVEQPSHWVCSRSWPRP